jgi:hypothetical protein
MRATIIKKIHFEIHVLSLEFVDRSICFFFKSIKNAISYQIKVFTVVNNYFCREMCTRLFYYVETPHITRNILYNSH